MPDPFIQSVDYRFNIRAWLTSINNASLDATGTNNELGDYFGMGIAYNTAGGYGNTTKHNGNITGIKWKGPGESWGPADRRAII